jgi:hypothetical protein
MSSSKRTLEASSWPLMHRDPASNPEKPVFKAGTGGFKLASNPEKPGL